ncbi:TetR/AcrR family transcriptional regulator [Altererythrobacter sp. BO-6]|uniref:TetR/AcrR family transcriptional regulator n=1 Tax=Altererythrobacter sp. BO-6 TaxID=2604537 RepID=UPI0013E14FA3|nr:TetR-like C-terminal domain-containing protein [Altererythrobacter sp. BO-6]QIG55220.1 TetR/AcrR family transcriptional regulator [Altererythrobacter sp. BO-6]
MNAIESSRRRNGDGAARLLAAARDLLDTHGADHVTIRETARRAGVSHAAPANHFADRRALLSALAAQDFEEMAQLVEAATDGLPPASLPRARAMADAVLKYALRHPHRYRLLWRADQLDITSAPLNEAMERLYANLLVTIGDDPDSEIEPSTSRSLALWSLVHGYVSLTIDNLFSLQADERTGAPRLHAMIELLFAD